MKARAPPSSRPNRQFINRRGFERAWTVQQARARLDGPHRRRHQDPVAFWRRVGLRRGETVLEVGAGTGFYALPAGERVGKTGRVYAADISEGLIEFLWRRRERRQVRNLFPLLSSPATIPLGSSSVDLVLFANVLHGAPLTTVAEALRILRPRGRLVVVEWKPTATEGGPPLSVRVSSEAVVERFGPQGFREADRWDIGEFHYALVLRRSRTRVG